MRLHLLKTILWLRWKLAVNQFSRAGAWLRVLMGLLTFAAALFMVALTLGGFFLGRTVLAKMPADDFMLVVDGLVLGFLFFWGIGILGEIQRSETIDLQRLLHLPVKLKDAFVVNYLASHFSISLLLITPAVSGLSIGLIVGGKTGAVVLPPLFFTLVFAVSSWTYCLRGWLVQLMVNPRRRRTIVIGMTVTIIVLAQTPNLFFNVYLHGIKDDGQKTGELVRTKMDHARGILKTAHYYVPPLWVGLGTAKSMDGNGWPAVGAALLLGAIGSAGVNRAYQSTLRFYRGENKRRPVKPQNQATEGKPVKNTLEGSLPFVDGDVSVAVLGFWRSMLRAPEMKMALLGPFIMALVIGSMFYTRRFGEAATHAGPLIVIGATLFSMSGVMQVVFNQFGWDRDGFRAIVLSPIDRGRLLLAKNISVFPVLTGVGLILFVGMSVMMRLNPLVVVGGVFQIVTATLILSVIGNYLSITIPHRVQAGSLKPTKMPAKNVLIMLVFTLLFPLYMLPALAGPLVGMLTTFSGSRFGMLLNVGVSAAVCVGTLFLYVLSIRPMGALLQRSERDILQAVTSELE